MVYSWTIHSYEFQESNILNHELLMNSSWIVHGSENRFYTMNSSWFTHEQFMVMNFRKAGIYWVWTTHIQCTDKFINFTQTTIALLLPNALFMYSDRPENYLSNLVYLVSL